MVDILVVCEPGRVIQEFTKSDADAFALRFPQCSFKLVDVSHEAEMREAVSRAEIIVGRVPQKYLKSAEKLRWHHLMSAGVNGYEHRELYPGGVILTRSAGVFGIPIAEHTLAMLLSLNRRLPLLGRQAARHEWRRQPVSFELYGSRVLMVGAGDLAREIITRLAGFGCEITALRRDASKPAAGCSRVYSYTEKLTALAEADYVIDTLPLTAETAGFIGAEELAAMKKTAMLINVGRGATVDTAALIAALEAGEIAGAGLDVVEPEPLPASSPLWDMENVIVTPHNSGDSLASDRRRSACFEENLRRYLAGEPLRYAVDFTVGY